MDRTRALSVLGFEEEPDTLALKNAYRERLMRVDLGDNTSGEPGEIRAAYRTLLVSPRDVSTLLKDARAENLTIYLNVYLPALHEEANTSFLLCVCFLEANTSARRCL